jgi:hypothetical protein
MSIRKVWAAVMLLAVILVSGPVALAGQRAGYGEIREAQLADFSLQALHDEIEADPLALGYKNGDGSWKGDAVIADLINAKSYKIDRANVEMETVRATVTYDAYNALALDEQEWIRWMTPNSGLFQVTADMKLQLSGRALASNGIAGTGTDGDSFWAAAG